MDERYTEKQIMTALEVCINDHPIYRAVYDLINQKNAEIEHLEAGRDRLENMLKDLMKDG